MNLTYEEVVERIQELSAEQQRIYRTAGESGLSSEQRRQLQTMRQTLQQLWEERKRLRTHLQDPLTKLVEWPERKAA